MIGLLPSPETPPGFVRCPRCQRLVAFVGADPQEVLQMHQAISMLCVPRPSAS